MSCKDLPTQCVFYICLLYYVSDFIPYQLPPHSLHPTYIDLVSVAQTYQAPSVLGFCAYSSLYLKCFSLMPGISISPVQCRRKDGKEDLKQVE